MKNNRIIESWNKIEPDAASEARILESILARKNSEENSRKNANALNKGLNWKRIAPIALSLLLLIAVVGVFGNSQGWFSNNTINVDLANGDTLSFYESGTDVELNKYAWDVDWGEVISRDFTEDEKHMLFGDIEFAYGEAIFRSADGGFMHYEGRTTDDIKINLSANGHPITDTIIVSNKIEISEINGIPVTANYVITDKNSKGIRTIIYYASFEANGTGVYVELAGDEADSKSLGTKIGALIDKLTANPPDTSKLRA